MGPDWNDYFLGIAKVVSSKSTCPSRSVGAVLVHPLTKHIIATGYNGAPRGTPHCGDDCRSRKSGGEWEKCKAIHAELNVIVSAALNGGKTLGGWLYLTTTPCVFCARVIINAGIDHVIASSVYLHGEAIDLLRSANVKVTVVQGVPMPILRERSDESE